MDVVQGWLFGGWLSDLDVSPYDSALGRGLHGAHLEPTDLTALITDNIHTHTHGWMCMQQLFCPSAGADLPIRPLIEHLTQTQRWMDGWICVCSLTSLSKWSSFPAHANGWTTHTHTHTQRRNTACCQWSITHRQHTAVSGPPTLSADSQDAPEHPPTQTRLCASFPPSPSHSVGIRGVSRTGQAGHSCPSVSVSVLAAVPLLMDGEGGGVSAVDMSGYQRCPGCCSRRPRPRS